MDERAIQYYAGHPVEFAADIIGVVPDEAQARVMRSVAEHSMTSVRSGHGVGKSAMQAWLILWFLCTRPYPKIPCTAPTKHQLYDILWAEVAKWHNQTLKSGVVWTYEKLYLANHPENWFAVPRTATQPDALQGFHAEHLFYIIDEASGVPDSIFAPVIGSLSTPGAKLLMCGNPANLSGFFFDSHNKNRHLYSTFRIPCSESPRVSPAYIRMVADMFGEESDVYRVRVLGEFPKAMPDSFIPLEWAEKCSKHVVDGHEPKVIDMGVDVARFGDDESVVAHVFDGARQMPSDIYRKMDTMQLAGLVAQAVRAYRKKWPDVRIRVKIDCDGLGVGVYDRLHELRLPCELFECHFGGRGGAVDEADPVEMVNATGLMWGRLRRLLKDGAMELWYDDMQIEQITNRKYRVVSDGGIALERKDEMKKRGVGSPDRADALALAVYEAEKRGGRFVAVTPSEVWGV